MKMVKRFTCPGAGFVLGAAAVLGVAGSAAGQAPINVAFLWHMHQPVYYPYESIVQTQANNRYSFNVLDIHNQRFGPYTTWPKNAVQLGANAGLTHLGASVSFTGSLIQNLNAMQAAGVNGGMWNNWQAGYNQGRALLTSMGNPRLDLVAFGFYHPMMPLLDTRDIQMQVRLHKQIYSQTWVNGGSYAKGMFPPECAFSTRIIPALVSEGIEWSIVDNIHFDRACVGYPHTNASNLYSPNKADQVNPDPSLNGGAWVQLNNLWAPSRVSAPFGYQPAQVQHIDPATGLATKMIAVPAARYEGNEDGRGGYGAFLYQTVMDQYRSLNTNAARPMLVLLHHDGDNYGGGTDSYYGTNFQSMVNWDAGTTNYETTTIQDYLQRFPVPQNAVIHVENGSWAGADNGDPEFKKWLGDPNGSGWSPDRNSWAVMTAARNRVYTADAISPYTTAANIINNAGSNTDKAWRFLLCGQASDYWYWDGSGEPWDSNVTVACNQAVAFADLVINGAPPSADTVPPAVFVPQRDPYNPGGEEFGTPQPSTFNVWTYAYDISGVQTINLKWRTDVDGVNPLASTQNETYAGGAEVSAWTTVPMTAGAAPTRPANITAPTYLATFYSAQVTGQTNKLVDYYVEATDGRGNLYRSDIQHVWVGANTPPPSNRVTISPAQPQAGGTVTVSYDAAGGPLASASPVRLHYGFNNWALVNPTDPAMTFDTGTQRWTSTLAIPITATQFDVVFNNGAGTWDNNSGADWHFPVQAAPPPPFTLDGVLDAGATLLTQSANGTMKIWAKASGTVLYLAIPDAGEGNDHFCYLAGQSGPGAMVNANWAKAGQIAQWGAFMADENSNDYEGWFDASGALGVTTAANGGVLEGTIDLAVEFGAMPSTIYVAAGAFGNADGGALVQNLQAPPTVVPNGNIEASEYLAVPMSLLLPPPACPGDLNGDGQRNVSDLTVFLGAFGTNIPPGSSGDLTGDGVVNVNDLTAFLGVFGTACP